MQDAVADWLGVFVPDGDPVCELVPVSERDCDWLGVTVSLRLWDCDSVPVALRLWDCEGDPDPVRVVLLL